MAKIKNSADRELAAMASILRALNGLDGESIERVFEYVLGRLSINSPRPKSAPISAPAVASSLPEGPRGRVVSIRDLRQEKQPESSNQMAALVAYYLSEVASKDEYKPTIGTADLEKYFKQAGFALPKKLSATLPNAAAAGYFEAVGNGQYRLNPVGYNLVVHALPLSSTSSAPRKKKKSKAKR